jgi:RNA polymerase sigma-70 factor (ECF subfamily)
VKSSAAACKPDATPGKLQISSRNVADEDLIARIRNRDQEAFACLLKRHLDAMHRYIYRLTGSSHDAEELTQETFLRVWEKASSYDAKQGKASTWLYRIAHNLCVDEFRRAKPDAVSGAIDTLADPAADQETQLAQGQRLTALQDALNELPQNQRSALLLCQVQGFSNGDAARILKISVSALESLLARARRSLRRTLSPTG